LLSGVIIHYVLLKFFHQALSGCVQRSGNRDRPIRPQNENKTPADIIAKAYPNPASTLLNVDVQLQIGKIENICIYNSLGELIRCENLITNHTVLSINTLPSGIYLYRITDIEGNLIKTDKVIIIH
jgi:type IX secretion system substrate protein